MENNIKHYILSLIKVLTGMAYPVVDVLCIVGWLSRFVDVCALALAFNLILASKCSTKTRSGLRGQNGMIMNFGVLS